MITTIVITIISTVANLEMTEEQPTDLAGGFLIITRKKSLNFVYLYIYLKCIYYIYIFFVFSKLQVNTKLNCFTYSDTIKTRKQ